MKKDIHPKYHDVHVVCATCQKEFDFKSTKSSFSVDICSGCHSVYTGNRSKAKSTGRVEKFNQRLAKRQK